MHYARAGRVPPTATAIARSAAGTSNGQSTEAARMLQISRATFYQKLAKFGLAAGPAAV